MEVPEVAVAHDQHHVSRPAVFQETFQYSIRVDQCLRRHTLLLMRLCFFMNAMVSTAGFSYIGILAAFCRVELNR